MRYLAYGELDGVPNIVVDGAAPRRLAAHALPLAEERIARGAARRPLGADRVPLPRPSRAARPGRGRLEQPLRPGRADERVRARRSRRRAGRGGSRRSTSPAPATSAPTRTGTACASRGRSRRSEPSWTMTSTRTRRSSSASPSCSTIPSASSTTGPTRTSTCRRSEAAIASGVVTIEERADLDLAIVTVPEDWALAAGAPLHPVGLAPAVHPTAVNNATDLLPGAHPPRPPLRGAVPLRDVGAVPVAPAARPHRPDPARRRRSARSSPATRAGRSTASTRSPRRCT